VHTEFSARIASLGRGDLQTEVAYRGGLVVKRGTPGSVRADVVEGTLERPIAIYDLKTGSARLTPTRIADIRSHLPQGFQDIPIIEIRAP